MTLKQQFKKSFSYTWYLYLLAIVIPCVAFPLSYSFMHRAKEHETLSVFLSCELKNDNAEDILLEKFKDKGVRKTEFVTSDANYNEVDFAKKLSVVAYNRCDIMVIQEDFIGKTGIKNASMEITSEVKELCSISDEKLYLIDDLPYAVIIPTTSPLYELADFKSGKNYYAFINQKSHNIGEFSSSKKYSNNAFELMKYFLGK